MSGKVKRDGKGIPTRWELPRSELNRGEGAGRNGEEIPQERLFSVPGAGALAEAEGRAKLTAETDTEALAEAEEVLAPKHYLNRDRDGSVAFPREIWPHSVDRIWQPGCQLMLKHGKHGRQHVYLSPENQFVREGPNTNQSQKERETTMTAQG